ncbi:hypothetical protein L0657_14005 [Dyadobacter sp. CY345]|uniref:hypothetical protein n=1 Tax=Dyadobacter sp. CY345 TaxID=2909335 RepID=UPI001F1EC612|nr:hypothetical protein [Dyadobacter sp. CY345]MCF2445076.1 hypothetical protein [Dyadobacter sp. CY345]
MKLILSLTKSTLTLFIFLVGLTSICNGQTTRKPDIIILKNNSKIEVSIQEVEDKVIKYKKLTDPDGPVFSVNKTEIASVLYGNGDVASFSETSSNEFFKEEGGAKPVELKPQPLPANKFDETIFAQKTNQLRQSYQYYKSRSKKGLVSGIVWTVLGTISMGVGTALITNSGYSYNGYGSYNYNNNEGTGALLLIGGLIGGATFGTIGFVKAGRNGSKATRIRRELLRRGEPISLKFGPGFNPVTNSGYLSLRMMF